MYKKILAPAKTNLIKLFIMTSLLCSNIYAIDKITIGTIDYEPKEKIKKFRTLADYLEEKLKNENIKFNVEIPANIQNAVKFINNNKLDIYIDSVYPTILVQQQTGLTIACKRWKKGQKGYKSVIFTKKESSINSINDLKGKTIAFEDEFSTSGFYIPKIDIEKRGLKLSNDDAPEYIKYLYARSEKNSAAWVLFGKVDASATDDGTFNDFDKNLFKIIYKSKLIPRHLVSFSKRIDKKLRDKIVEILFAMEKDPEGSKVLKKFSKTKRFSPLSKEDMKLIQGL